MKELTRKFLCALIAVIITIGILPVNAVASSTLTISTLSDWEYIAKSGPPNLIWNKVSGAGGYAITIKNDVTGEYYIQNKWTTNTKYSLRDFFDENLDADEYPRLKIWVGAMKSRDMGEGLVDVEAQDSVIVVVSDYPELSFDSTSSVTSNSVTLKMTISKDFGSAIIDSGFYIGTSSSVSKMTKYSFADYGSYSATSKGTKTMTITGLSPDTTYYVSAYAENGLGEEYTSTKNFTTKEEDGYLYLSQSSVSWGYNTGNEANITVDCSGSYSYKITYNGITEDEIKAGYDYEWLDVTQNGNVLNLRPLRANYALEDRIAIVTVTSGSLSKSVTVKQTLYTKGSPTISFSRAEKILKDGDNLGAYELQNNSMTIDVSLGDVRRLYAELISVSSGEKIDTFVRPDKDNNTDMSKISFDMSSLKAGNYKIIIYASNSPTANDYWSQSPFDDKKFELYFSMVDGSSGGGESESNENFPKSYSEAENMVVFSKNKVAQGVTKGKIRHIPQVKSADPNFCDEYWIGYDTNGNKYDTVSGAIGYCTRAVYSMALSYFGIDCTPGKMAALMKTSGEIDGNNYNQVTTLLKADYKNLSYANKGNLSDLFENYVKNKSFSPVYVYFGEHDYNGRHSTGHAILVIGRDPSNPNKYYCVEPDYGTGGNITTMVVNDDATKTTDYTWASCRGREILYCYQWKYTGDFDDEVRTFTITYNYNYDGGAIKTETKKYGEAYTISRSTVPTRPSTETETTITTYKFEGWAIEEYGNVVYQPGDAYTENKNLTLYAQWISSVTNKNQSPDYKVSVAYDANGGENAPEPSSPVSPGTKITLSTEKPTRSGYTFQGWAESPTAASAQYQPGDEYTVNEGITLYAVWKKNASQTTYTVKYDANGGSGAPAAQTKTEGKTLTLSSKVPTWNGYIFQGWATSKTATTAQYQPGDSYTKDADITLYAVWEEESQARIIASGYCGGEGDGTNLVWELGDDGTLTISGSGAMKDYSSGDDITTAPWGEYTSSLKTLVIEDGVTTIGNYAFYKCDGFAGELVIPSSITTIKEFAFCGCSGFTGNLVIPDGVTTIEYSAFRLCTGFTGDLVIGNNVTTIGDKAFYKCNSLTGSLVIPDSVTNIGKEAFRSCDGFTGDLIIGNGVTTIGIRAFYMCDGFTGDLVIGNSVTTIGGFAFDGCAGFTGNLVIGSSVTIIEEYAFYGCAGFAGNLVIPDSVTTIGEHAFEGCTGFTGDLVIGNSVTTIKGSAFDGCAGFTGNLVIGSSVTIIENYAFYGCAGFAGNLVIPDSVTTIGKKAFYNSGINEYYFEGDAPSVFSATESYPSFDVSDDIIYYPSGNNTWIVSDGKWNGYRIETWEVEPEVIYGDINLDGSVDVKDAYYARLIAAKLLVPTEEQLTLGDVDLDGKITAIDANLIRKFAAKIISSLPVEM